jgi:hypothetical protein
MHKAKSHGEIPSLKNVDTPDIAHTYGLARDTALIRAFGRGRIEGSAVADDPACMEKYGAVL